MTEAINLALLDHQLSSDWEHQQLMTSLHTWAERFILRFKLQTGVPALCVDRLRRSRLGHYCPARNPFGLRDEIALDATFVRAAPFWRVLGTLLHECLHSWQTTNGKPGKGNYHNRVFQAKALELGLIINARGYTQFLKPPTAFWSLLQEHGFEVSEQDVPSLDLKRESRVGSKLKLWVCSCPTRARVATDFQARCLVCNSIFERKERS